MLNCSTFIKSTHHSQVKALLENSVTYISGWVAYKLLGKIQCGICKSVLLDNGTLQHRSNCCLIIMKNGVINSLTKPSSALVKVNMRLAIFSCVNMFSVHVFLGIYKAFSLTFVKIYKIILFIHLHNYFTW